MTRREWMMSAAAASAVGRPLMAAAPTAPVAIAKCTSYGPELVSTLNTMFDQIGGLERIVKNKTVAMKVNLTGSPNYRLGYRPAELAHWTHPAVIGATIAAMNRAGAKRVRILESPWSTAEPIEEVMYEAGWNVASLLNAGGKVAIRKVRTGIETALLAEVRNGLEPGDMVITSNPGQLTPGQTVKPKVEGGAE